MFKCNQLLLLGVPDVEKPRHRAPQPFQDLKISQFAVKLKRLQRLTQFLDLRERYIVAEGKLRYKNDDEKRTRLV